MELNFSSDVTNPKNESYKENKGNVARTILIAIAYPMRKGIKPHKIKNNLHLTWKKKKNHHVRLLMQVQDPIQDIPYESHKRGL